MRIRTPLFAAGALAATLALGAGVVHAQQSPQLNDLYVLDQDAYTVTWVVDAPAALAGQPCRIQQGHSPYSGDVVHGFTLAEGPNLTHVPQGGGDWVTADGPGFQARSAGNGTLDDGLFE